MPDFKPGDEVYWDTAEGTHMYRTVRRVGPNHVYFTNAGMMPIERVYLASPPVDSGLIPFPTRKRKYGT